MVFLRKHGGVGETSKLDQVNLEGRKNFIRVGDEHHYTKGHRERVD